MRPLYKVYSILGEVSEFMKFVEERGYRETKFYFPLDIIAIDSNFHIVKIFENVLPNNTMISIPTCKHVLELPAGTAKECGIEIGNMAHGIPILNFITKSESITKCEACQQDCNCVQNSECNCKHLDCMCPEFSLLSNYEDPSEELILDLKQFMES